MTDKEAIEIISEAIRDAIGAARSTEYPDRKRDYEDALLHLRALISSAPDAKNAPLPKEVEEAMVTLHEAAYGGYCFKYHVAAGGWWAGVLKAEGVIRAALARPTTEQCPACEGSGREPIGALFVTAYMASDAGQPDRAGESMGIEYGPCSECGGVGIKIAPPIAPVRVSREVIRIIINNLEKWRIEDWGSDTFGDYVAKRLREKGVIVDGEEKK